MSDALALLSPRACSACQKYKRRCDKAWPECSLCERLGKVCQYSPIETEASVVTRIKGLEAQIAALSSSSQAQATTNGLSIGPPSGECVYPDALRFQIQFLDPELQPQGEAVMPPSSKLIPPSVVYHVGEHSQRANIVTAYFDTVHQWAPVVGRVRLLALLDSTVDGELRADVALLVSAMKLVQRIPPDSHGAMQDELYITTKEYAARLDILGVYSLAKLQANILVSLYEMGHGIFPAGYTSMGNCVAQAMALGIHRADAPMMLPRTRNWLDWEERQRTWWLIVIIDRYLTSASVNKPVLSADPMLASHLPADDKAWDSGESVPPERLFLSSPKHISTSPFARLAQAAHLLGEVVKHCNDGAQSMKDVQTSVEVLTDALFAFLRVLGNDQGQNDASYYGAVGVCLSALLKLLNQHSCDSFARHNDRWSGLEDLALARTISLQCQAAMKEALVMAADLAGAVIQSHDMADCERFSPWFLDCIYQAMSNFIYLSSTLPANDAREFSSKKEMCASVLSRVDVRWKVAGRFSPSVTVGSGQGEAFKDSV